MTKQTHKRLQVELASFGRPNGLSSFLVTARKLLKKYSVPHFIAWWVATTENGVTWLALTWTKFVYPFGLVLVWKNSYNMPFWIRVHLCPKMQPVTKMAILAKFRQLTRRFYANYINKDGPDVLANLTILAIFVQITMSYALYFLRSVSMLANRIPRYKGCYPLVTESQIYLPFSNF